jgi:hypothetical protein
MSSSYFDSAERNPFLIQERIDLAEITSASLDAERKKVGDDTRKAASQEKAPSTRDATVVNPLTSLNTPTSQFDVTKIPLDKLHQMRRDPIIAFALFFIKAQLMKARWVIECEDAQVAAFVDGALREIYASLVTQYLLKLDYGWSAVVKRFTLSKPDWTYIDNGDPSKPEGGPKATPPFLAPLIRPRLRLPRPVRRRTCGRRATSSRSPGSRSSLFRRSPLIRSTTPQATSTG